MKITDKATFKRMINQLDTNATNILVSPKKNKIAEFNIQVDRPRSSTKGAVNFVELLGTIGLKTQTKISETVTLIVARKNVSLEGSETIIFTAPHTVTNNPSASTLLSFSYTDGNIDELITAGNYLYSLYIQRTPLNIKLPILDPVIIQGPITFTGTSFLKS